MLLEAVGLQVDLVALLAELVAVVVGVELTALLPLGQQIPDQVAVEVTEQLLVLVDLVLLS